MLASAPKICSPVPPSSPRGDLRKNIRLSLWEGGAFSLMVGMGETYLPAFILWMHLGDVASGLITTLPLMAGSVMQLLAPRALSVVGSYRRWVLLCALVQAAVFLPLAASALWGKLPIWLAFGAASLYWAAGLGASSAWNSWMGTLLPGSVQVSFFTKRTRITQGMVLVGFIVGGMVLHWLPRFVDKRWAYLAVFLGAFGCRAISVWWLRRQTEPVPPPPAPPKQSLMPQTPHAWKNAQQRQLFTYLFCVTFTAHLAAPYFTSFMLTQMQLPYSQYSLLIAASYLGKVWILPYLGTMSHARGTRPVLLLGGFGIVGLPALWLISHDLTYLTLVQLFSGVAWAAYELASLLLIWELVKPHERTAALTFYNLGHAIAMSSGSLVGGALLALLGAGAGAFTVLFAVSTVARGCTLLLLKDISAPKLRWIPAGFRTLSLRPSLGSVAMPIFTGLKSWRQRHRSEIKRGTRSKGQIQDHPDR